MSARTDTPPTTPPAISPDEAFTDGAITGAGVEMEVVVDAERLTEAEEDKLRGVVEGITECPREAMSEPKDWD